MKKRIYLFFTVFSLLIVCFGVWNLRIFSQTNHKKIIEIKIQLAFAQSTEDEERRAGKDSYEISLLKQIKTKVDGWLKSLNERIEREDITRFEVRFLEILRNILEWVKEKIDARIKADEEKKKNSRREEII